MTEVVASTARLFIGLCLATGTMGRTPNVLTGRALARASATRLLPGGSALRTLSLPQHPFALAVDAPTHRLLTLNGVTVQVQADGGVQFTGFRFGSVSVLDPTSGAVLHTVPLGGYTVSDRGVLAVDAKSGRVYVPTHGPSLAAPGTLLAVDGRSGVVLQRLALGSEPQDLVVDARTRRIFVSEYGHLSRQGAVVRSGDVRVFDATTGRLLRVVGPGGRIGPTLFGGAMALDAQHGRVYVVNVRGQPSKYPSVIGLYTTTSAVLWSEPITDTSTGINSLAVDGLLNRVLTGAYDVPGRTGRVHLLDGTSGRLLATTDQVSGDVGVSVAVDAATGHAFVAAGSDSSSPFPVEVSLLETRRGRLLRTTDVDIPAIALFFQRVSGVAVDGHRGRLFVGIDTTSLSGDAHASYVGVLSTRSADVLRRLRVGVGPSRLALDAQAGRLYVSNYADKSVSVIDETHL